MTTPLTVTRVDSHRVDCRRGDKLLAYAIQDAFGWVVLARRGGRIRCVRRFDHGPAAWRAGRLPKWLWRAASGVA